MYAQSSVFFICLPIPKHVVFFSQILFGFPASSLFLIFLHFCFRIPLSKHHKPHLSTGTVIQHDRILKHQIDCLLQTILFARLRIQQIKKKIVCNIKMISETLLWNTVVLKIKIFIRNLLKNQNHVGHKEVNLLDSIRKPYEQGKQVGMFSNFKRILQILDIYNFKQLMVKNGKFFLLKMKRKINCQIQNGNQERSLFKLNLGLRLA